MKYMLLFLLFLVCQPSLSGRNSLHVVREVPSLFQDPVKGKKQKPGTTNCKPVKTIAKIKPKSPKKIKRKRGNMGNTGGRGNMYFARNNP